MTFNDPRPAESNKQTKLVLEDGSEMVGSGFGMNKAVCGEVVFNTGMTGYVESLTDPSYRGQILVFTYPLIGNYGVPPDRPPDSIERPYESAQIQVLGLVVQHYVPHYSHHSGTRSLGDWIQSQEVAGVSGIDTRALTRRLRETGTMQGWLFPIDMPLEQARETAQSVDMADDLFHLVACEEPIYYDGGEIKVMLVDVGAKDNIVRSLLARDVSVTKVPWHARLADFLDDVDGIVIGNGPGNPKDLDGLIGQLKDILQDFRKPIFGICLGNQLLALAAGGDTYKLPYGHRGVNQPVQDLLTRQCYITSQNHGYAVNEHSLPSGWEPWFVNINDGSNEGIRSRIRPWSSIQFHPEAQPGPKDTEFLFDDFLRIVGASRS